MKKRRLMLCSIISLIMVFVMAVPMTVSAATNVTTADQLKAEVAKGGDITLGADIEASIEIPAGVTVTLDLNGKTLTNEAGKDTIINNGTLTVTGSGNVDNVSHAKAAVYNNPGATVTLNGGDYTRSKENGITKEDNGGNSFYTLLNHGTMIINSGVKVTQNGNFSSMVENGWYNGAENTAKTNAKLTINGGSFSGGLNTIKNDDYGELLIKDGTFTNVSQAALLNWNIAEIEGGNFDGIKASDAVILNGKIDSVMDQGILTIKDGIFKGGDKPAIKMMDSKRNFGTIKIEGGEFDSTGIISGTPKTNDSIDISGGSFNSDPGEYVVKTGDDAKAVLVLDKDEYLVIYKDDDYARVLGATCKDMRDTPYYYLDKEDVGEGELESLGHSVDFYAMQPKGSIDYEQSDSITVPDEKSVKEFLAVVNEKYKFDGKAYAITDPKAVDGYKFLGWYNGKAEWNGNDDTKLDFFAYGEKFDFDQKITKDTEVFAAWEKVGSGSNEPTQPGNLDKPSKDNGAVAKADKSAKTGDDFNLFAVGGVALAAIIAMAAVAITGRRHRQR